MAFLDLFATGSAIESVGSSRIERMVGLFEGVRGVSSLEPVWRKLGGAARDQAVFSDFGFALAAARYHEARGHRVLAAVARWNDRPAAILPIAVTRRCGVTVGKFLGDPVAQYGDLMMVRNAPAQTAEIALQRIAETARIDVFEFRRVRSDAAILPALRKFAQPAGQGIEAPFADLAFARSADAFLLSVGGAKPKRERARSRRRLAERGAIAFEALTGAEAVPALRHALALKRAWLQRQGDASPVIDDPEALRLLEGLALDPGQDTRLVVGRLSAGGATAAYEVGLLRGRRFHAYLGVVADGFASASPGKIAMEETLGWCIANGVEIYDLLPPADAYKRHWANGSVKVQNYVAPVTLAGRLYAGPWLGRVRPRLRATLEAMPAGVRRRLGSAALRIGA